MTEEEFKKIKRECLFNCGDQGKLCVKKNNLDPRLYNGKKRKPKMKCRCLEKYCPKLQLIKDEEMFKNFIDIDEQ